MSDSLTTQGYVMNGSEEKELGMRRKGKQAANVMSLRQTGIIIRSINETSEQAAIDISLRPQKAEVWGLKKARR